MDDNISSQKTSTIKSAADIKKLPLEVSMKPTESPTQVLFLLYSHYLFITLFICCCCLSASFKMTSERIEPAIAHCSLSFQLLYDFVCLSAVPVFCKDSDAAPLPTTSCSPQKCPQYPTGSYCFSAPHPGSRPIAATKSRATKVQGCSQVSAAYTCNQSYRKVPSS